MESRWIPKTSESNFRGQNSMTCGVFYIIEKILECRCLKWARIAHLDIWNTSYDQKKGRESSCQFDSRPEKVENDLVYLIVDDVPHTVGKLSMRATTCFRQHLNPRSTRTFMGLQSCESPGWNNFGTPTRESWERKAIWMWALWRGVEYTIRGKVVASLKSGPWWILCVHVARDSS